MRSIKFNLSKKPENAWEAAVMLVEAYLTLGVKSDQVLGLLPDDFIGQKRARCQSLFLGALRHGHRCRAAYQPLLRKKPRPLVEAVLILAGYELCTEEENRHPKIVHFAVGRSKLLANRHEQGFLNAVLRKLPAALAAIDEQSALADFHSHPDWLVSRWLEDYGLVETTALLRWNQQIPEQMLRIYEPAPDVLPDCLETSQWEGFYKINRATNWNEAIKPFLDSGCAYIKDPSTRIAPALLAPGPGSTVLDLCAAPGGKSFDLAAEMNNRGHIVSVDLPGSRINRLRSNLSKLEARGVQTAIVESDLLELEPGLLKKHGLPPEYDFVMLDAPCSNSGVIQRRTDVKWRLRPKDFEQCAHLQLKLIKVAVRFVKPGGRIVYSTCSIDTEENRKVVDAFLLSTEGQAFREMSAVVSLPWESGHDGAGAFLLAKTN